MFSPHATPVTTPSRSSAQLRHGGLQAAATGIIASLLGAAALSPAAADQDSAAFYNDRTVTMVVGAQAGTTYDVRARLLTRHIARHIPGNPSFVTQNMPGAGFLIAANWLYNVAPRDGSTLGAVSYSLPAQPVLATSDKERAQYRFDARKFGWIGSLEKEPSVGYCRRASGFTRFEDFFKREAIVIGSTPQSNSLIQPYVVSGLLGIKFKIIAGYQGVSAPAIALERGEGDCHFSSYGSVKTHHGKWFEPNGFASILVVVGQQVPEELKGTPRLIDHAKTEEQRGAINLLVAPQEMSRPYFVPPEVPANRLKTLRAAFLKTTQDAEFREDAKRSGADLDVIGGEEIEALLEKIYATPPSAVAALKAAMPPVGSKTK